jgi:hypothetical protein
MQQLHTIKANLVSWWATAAKQASWASRTATVDTVQAKISVMWASRLDHLHERGWMGNAYTNPLQRARSRETGWLSNGPGPYHQVWMGKRPTPLLRRSWFQRTGN